MTVIDMHAEDKVRAQADPSHRCYIDRCLTCFANMAVDAINAKNESLNGYCRELDAMSRERGALGREVIILRSKIGGPA